MILEGRVKRDFDGRLPFHRESRLTLVPHPCMFLGFPSWGLQSSSEVPGWAQKTRPLPGGAGHLLPAVLSGDSPAGPWPAPPRIQEVRPVARRAVPRCLCVPGPCILVPEPAAHHGHHSRAPQPGRSPGAGTRPGSDRKSRRLSGTKVLGAEPGFRIQKFGDLL